MIKISDIKYIKEIKFSLENFTWTIIGGLLMNVIFVTTTFFVGISSDKSLIDIVKTIPYALMIANMASLFIFPILDVRAYISDRVMCRELGWDYSVDFIDRYTSEQLQEIRENYSKLMNTHGSKPMVIEQINKFITELQNNS